MGCGEEGGGVSAFCLGESSCHTGEESWEVCRAWCCHDQDSGQASDEGWYQSDVRQDGEGQGEGSQDCCQVLCTEDAQGQFLSLRFQVGRWCGVLNVFLAVSAQHSLRSKQPGQGKMPAPTVGISTAV